MKSDLEKKLENMNPKKLTSNEKSYMWSHIKSEIASKVVVNSKSFFSIFSFDNLRKYGLVPALITAFLAGSISTTIAFADNATPGDFLFPVDIAAEKILLTLTFGDNNDELRLRFSEERLDEVKSLLALAEVAVLNEDNQATSTNNNNDTSTSTDNGADDNSTSTPTNNSDDTDEDQNSENINKAQNAFLVALAHLEDAREALLSKGNELGVSVIDDMIAELTDLAEDHIANLKNFKVSIKENNDKIKIAIDISTDKIKTKFKFEQDLNGGDDNTELEVTGNKSGSKTKVDDGEFKISQTTKNVSNKKNNRVEICHTSFGKSGKQQTKKVSEFSLDYYLDRGDTLGECEDEDDSPHGRDNDNDGDDDDDKGKKEDKKIKICHKDKNTIEVSTSAGWAHLIHGDKKGECDDDGDNDGDEDDTTPPTISNLSASVGINSAQLTFGTNENTTSIVWYNTETPVTPESPTPSVSVTEFKTSHTVTINSLIASTTYYILVEVTDEAGNTTTSLERIITTDPEPEPDPSDITPPIIGNITSDPRITAADISWTTDENSNSKVWYSQESPVTPLFPTAFVSSGSFIQNHFLTINSLNASTTYYFVVQSEDNEGNIATSSEQSFTTDEELEPVDETPPVISNIGSTPTTTEATITWDTDESATSKVLYSDSSPIDPDSDDSVESPSLVTSHVEDLTSLTPDTTYYYLVVSADSDGNTATSSEQSFVTDSEPEPTDETAPVISGIGSSEISTTTATISWSTDEDADSTVYYGTDDPLDINTATSLNNTSLSQDHSFDLVGLVASTTYQYIVVSSDESGNASTSTQESFTTL